MWSDWSVFTSSTWTFCGRLGNGMRQGAPASLGGTCVELLRLVGKLDLLGTHKRQPPHQKKVEKKTENKIKMDSWLTTATTASALFLDPAVLSSSSHWSHLLLQAEALPWSWVDGCHQIPVRPKLQQKVWLFHPQPEGHVHQQWGAPIRATPQPPHTFNGLRQRPCLSVRGETGFRLKLV